MSILPGIVFSRARWTPIRTRNETMDREVYLDNDHFIDYRIQERTTGKFTSGLELSVVLSLNPTGSAATSSFLGPAITRLTSASVATSSVTQIVQGGFTESIVFHSSQSILFTSSGSNPGGVSLSAVLIEDPACSGQYVGTILGPTMSVVLSSSFSESLFTESSSSVTTASFSASISASVTLSLSVTMSVTGSTSSIITTAVLPIGEAANPIPGVFEIISSGSFLKASTPMTLKRVRFIP